MTMRTADLVQLGADDPSDPRPEVLDDLSLAIQCMPAAQGAAVPDDAARWVGYLRRIGAAKLNAWGLTCLTDTAQLLISELVTNAFQHGNGTGRQVVFHLVIGTHMIALEVDDGSPDRPQVRIAGPDEENGRGMLLVDALATSWGVSEDGTSTWCALATPWPKQASR